MTTLLPLYKWELQNTFLTHPPKISDFELTEYTITEYTIYGEFIHKLETQTVVLVC